MKSSSKKSSSPTGRVVRQAHNGNAVDYVIENHISSTPENIIEESKLEAFKIIRKTQMPVKINFKFHCVFEHINNETGEITEDTNFMSTQAIRFTTLNDLEEKYEDAKEDILEKIFKYVNKGSGWRLKKILDLHLHISKYDPINGNSYIKLPEFYNTKKSIINVKNDDQECGKWAITISLNQDKLGKHPKRVSKKVKELAKNYNWEGVEFPMTVKGIEIFERNNKDIGIVCFTTVGNDGRDLEKITPLYISKNIENYEKVAKIFVIWGHYCVIANEGAFLGVEQGHNRAVVCRRCLYKAVGDSKISAEDRMENHMRFCRNNDYCLETFPKIGIFKFKNHSAVAKHNILISGDFECILAKLDSDEKKNTVPTEVHIPISCGINVDRQDGQNEYFEYVGLDSARVFVEKIEEIAKDYLEEFGEPRPMINIEEANEAVRRATKCYICDLPFGSGNLVAVRDHDHNTGEFRGVAHNKCNLLLRRKKLLPVILHNLSGYDESLFFRELVLRDYVKIIPKNEENFISFSKIIEMGERK